MNSCAAAAPSPDSASTTPSALEVGNAGLPGRAGTSDVEGRGVLTPGECDRGTLGGDRIGLGSQREGTV